MLKNWINIFFYQIKNNKLFTALNVLGLSIGIAGLIFAILYWNDEQSYDQWNPNKDNVFLVANQMDATTYWSSSSAPIGSAIQAISPEVESYCYLSGSYDNEILYFNNKKVQSDKIVIAQKNFFDYFPYEFIEGNQKAALPDVNSICLSQDLAINLFGNETALGKKVVLQKRVLIVRGVYKLDKKSVYNPSCVVNFMDERVKETIQQWGNFQFVLLLKLKNPADQKLVTQNLQKIYFENMTARYAKDQGIKIEEFIKKFGEVKPSLEPLSSIRLHSKTGSLIEAKGNLQFLLIMVGLSVLILLLSIVNYINSATANAIKRAKEVGVRKIIGASKFSIIKQFIFETAIISLFSILISLVIVEISLPYYNAFLEKSLVLQSSQFYLQLVAIFFITVVLAGILPAIYVANFEPLKVLKGNFGRSKNGIWLRNGMLIFQFAVASFFIVGSYIVYEQIELMNAKDLGFSGKQILNISYRNIYGESITEKDQFARYNSIRNQLQHIKGVQQVAGGGFVFGSGAKSVISYHYKDKNIDGSNVPIDFGLLEMMKIKIVKGRYLSPKFAQDTITSMLINESALKLLNEKNPIGKKLNWNGNDVIIVGVVKDFNIGNPGDPIPPMTFFHFKTVPWFPGLLNNIYITADPKTMQQTIADIEKFWTKKVDIEYPFSYDFVDKEYKRSYSNYVKQKNLFSLLNVIVIVIALFGLFALASYSIERRMKEIAIRKTLGADTNILLKELCKQYVIFSIIGFLIALFPVYYFLNKWLDNFAYRINISVFPFLIGFTALLILTLLVVLTRAYQATKIDILKYLKYE
ncbi:ABC transporter permease [Flavobacterium hydatis]|jgi:putative ABC transport system permease protein|uniref:Multidrug ABC transporter substrate-binding protein n=1 Tax=Flavobacterium hydatis TaxID=991 RepID=A0A086A053_FLAHY|nr:ABC transporter permease [Flavobacterium hydatis]KFF10067.1 multidrug ABC transporter substrate-binding protein [Flavobacterium hydatis]OXA93297.1 multidrug ABC transporter substrate-binding protein [Flavobacterium hydatis]